MNLSLRVEGTAFKIPHSSSGCTNRMLIDHTYAAQRAMLKVSPWPIVLAGIWYLLTESSVTRFLRPQYGSGSGSEISRVQHRRAPKPGFSRIGRFQLPSRRPLENRRSEKHPQQTSPLLHTGDRDGEGTRQGLELWQGVRVVPRHVSRSRAQEHDWATTSPTYVLSIPPGFSNVAYS